METKVNNVRSFNWLFSKEILIISGFDLRFEQSKIYGSNKYEGASEGSVASHVILKYCLIIVSRFT